MNLIVKRGKKVGIYSVNIKTGNRQVLLHRKIPEVERAVLHIARIMSKFDVSECNLHIGGRNYSFQKIKEKKTREIAVNHLFNTKKVLKP